MATQLRAFATIGSGSSPRTVAIPTGTVAGDLLLLQVAITVDIASNALPSGFVLVAGAEITGTNNIRIYAKIAGGSEPASYDVGFASGQAALGLAALYSDTAAELVVDALALSDNASSGDRLWAEVFTTQVNTILMCFATLPTASTTPPGGMTERWDLIGSAPRPYLMTATIAAAGATGTRTATGAASASRCITLAVGELVTPPPDAPSGLTATPITGSRIDLSWVASPDAVDGYSVEQSPNGSTGWVEIGTPTATNFSVTGLSQNTEYWFRVRAYVD